MTIRFSIAVSFRVFLPNTYFPSVNLFAYVSVTQDVARGKANMRVYSSFCHIHIPTLSDRRLVDTRLVCDEKITLRNNNS
jgi:hypothetical protein